MTRVVKEIVGGKPYYAVWSSVVMDLVSDYMPAEAMARFLKKRYPRATKAEIAAWLESAVHPDDV